MSIADKLQRIIDTKDDIRDAIEAKGRDLTNKTFEDDYAAEIAAIETGGGGVEVVGQEVLTGEFEETINEFEPVSIKKINKNINFLNSLLSAIPSTGESVNFSSDDVYLAVGHANSPFVTIMKRNGDIFTKLPNPDILPPQTVKEVAFSFNTEYLAAVNVVSSPFLTIYKRNGDAFNKLPNPDILPGAQGNSVSFSPDDTYLAVGSSSSPFLIIYKRDGDTFTKLPDPSILPTSPIYAKFSPDGMFLAVIYNQAPRLIIYKRNGDVFTKLPDPTILPSTNVLTVNSGLSFSYDNKFLAVSLVSSAIPGTVLIYERDGDNFNLLPQMQQIQNILVSYSSFNTLTGVPIYPIAAANFFSKDSKYFFLGLSNFPHWVLFKIEGNIFTKIPLPERLLLSSPNGGDFTSDNTYLAIGYAGGFQNRVIIFKQNILENFDQAIVKISKTSIQLNDYYKHVDHIFVEDLGYALESGVQGEQKQVVSLFRKQ